MKNAKRHRPGWGGAALVRFQQQNGPAARSRTGPEASLLKRQNRAQLAAAKSGFQRVGHKVKVTLQAGGLLQVVIL